MFVIAIFAALAIFVGVVIFLALFRAEGILAFYLIGGSLLLLLAETFQIPWSTVFTGLVRPICFIPLVMWWFLAPRPHDELYLPRRLSLPMIVLVLMCLVWQAKYWFERSYIPIINKYEYLKWAYMIQDWLAVLLLGWLMPLTLKRLQRLLAAMGALGTLWAVMQVGFFVTGHRDMAERATEGARYQFAVSIGSLSLGLHAGVGAACLLGWQILKTRHFGTSFKRNIFVGILFGLMSIAVLLTGSRGPMVSMFATFLAFLLMMGGKNAVRFSVGLAVFGILLYVGMEIIPDTAKERLFGHLFGKSGVSARYGYLLDAMNILNVAPLTGQTIGLIPIIGMTYSHQLFSQVMVELGLIGLGVFLAVSTVVFVKWVGAARHRNRDVWVFAGPLAVWLVYEFVQRNLAAGQLGSVDYWLLMGLLAGHKLELVVPEVEYWQVPDEVAMSPAYEAVVAAR